MNIFTSLFSRQHNSSQIVDHTTVKLGKLARKEDKRTLKLSKYASLLPPAKPAVDWSTKISDWGMMKNDQIGDCAIAAPGHMIMCWTSNSGNVFVPTDNEIVSAYSAVTGYDPNDPSTDRGSVELDVLNYWRNNGIANHKIGAFAAVDVKNIEHVKQAIEIFGGLYIGLNLPASAQNQPLWDVTGFPWSSTSVPGSWGGHAVTVLGYDCVGLTCITWGATQNMTWRFWQKYCDECYAIISTDWLDGKNVTPEGFDINVLKEDLTHISQ